MSKKVIKPIVLVIVFIVAIILFGITTNKGNKDMTTTMAAARLPVISFYSGGNLIDQAHGYVDDMDEKLMRDSIIPVQRVSDMAGGITTLGILLQLLSQCQTSLLKLGWLIQISFLKCNLSVPSNNWLIHEPLKLEKRVRIP